TRSKRDWSSDVCSSDLDADNLAGRQAVAEIRLLFEDLVERLAFDVLDGDVAVPLHVEAVVEVRQNDAVAVAREDALLVGGPVTGVASEVVEGNVVPGLLQQAEAGRP